MDYDPRAGDEDDWLVRAAAAEVGADGAADDLHDRDDNSFEDSERFEDDSLCSWMSTESLTNTQNWRGWASRGVTKGRNGSVVPDDAGSPVPGPSNRLSALSGRHSAASSTNTLVHTPATTKIKGSSPRCLSDLCATICARHLSFDLLEENYHALTELREHDPTMTPLPKAIPDRMFLSIIERCFPDSEDDIRLYSCLANGNADEFSRGEALFQTDAVHEAAQIGYHVSAIVTSSICVEETAGQITNRTNKAHHNVSARVDRCRIVWVSCSCNAKAQWCQHVVALCLHRIHKPKQVEYRVTIWDSVNDLSVVQLRKFAQYLVNELPRQYLPVAQKLIDVLRDPHSSINQSEGAPDPTDGGHEQVAIWALEQNVLHDNIRKILTKFCVPAPQVHCDVHLLSSTQPPIASEWQSLFRPLRNREPEGLWNLVSIVREMYRRRDENATTLLHIITEECLASRQVLMWWFTTKLAQSGKWTLLGSSKGSALLSNQHNAQFNCSELCDEIVRLWRYAALNPRLSYTERQQLSAYLQLYHRTACERIWTLLGTTVPINDNPLHQLPQCGLLISQLVDENGVRLSPLNVHFNRTTFPGFFDALEACQVGWNDIYIEGVDCGDRVELSEDKNEDVLSIDVTQLDGQPGSCPSPNMPFLKGKYKIPKVYDFPLPTLHTMPHPSLFTPLEMSQPSVVVHKKKKKVKKSSSRHGASSSSHHHHQHQGRGASEPYLPEFFDARTLRHAAREASQRAARLAEEVQEESTESGQESDLPPTVPVEGGQDGDGAGPSQPTGPSFPQEEIDLLLASAHVSLDGVDLKFVRCEALHIHGYDSAACDRALDLLSSIYHHPPDLSPPTNLLQLVIKHHNEKSSQAERMKNNTEDNRNWNPKTRRVPGVVRVGGGGYGVEGGVTHPIPQRSVLCSDLRMQLISERTVKTMERALFIAQTLMSNPLHQRSVFSFLLYILELPKAPMTSRYLQVKLFYLESELVSLLRLIEVGPDELHIVRERASRLSQSASKALVPPVALAHFILDSLSYTQNMFPNGVNSGPSTAKNIGRRPSDDDIALSAALEALGAKQVFGDDDCPMLNESIRRQRGELALTLLVRHKDSNEKLGLILDKLLDPVVHKMYKNHNSNAVYFLQRDPAYQKYGTKGARPKYPYKPEEKIEDKRFVDTVTRSSSCQSAGSSIGSSEGQSADDETEAVTQTLTTLSFPSEDGLNSASTTSESGSPDQPPAYILSTIDHPSETDDSSRAVDLTVIRRRKHLSALIGGSLATEASVHFYTELAKRVLIEAGGTQSTVMFNAAHAQPVVNNNQQHGPHRKLHISSFLIGVYALGLNNEVNTSWPTRTYSTHVSWITGQTLEIGISALEILRETWPSHLTPTEVAALADKASQSREATVVTQATHLALSVLPYAHALTAAESQRALYQCRDQSPILLESACRAIEQASESGDGVYPEVLFRVARMWNDLHNEIEGVQLQQTQSASSFSHPPFIQQPPPNLQYIPQQQQYDYGQQQPQQQGGGGGYLGYDPNYPYGYHHHHSHGVPPPPPPNLSYYGIQQPPPMSNGGHHRPHSVYMQQGAGGVQQYGNVSSLGVPDDSPSLPSLTSRPPPIHQSHSAPNLNPIHPNNSTNQQRREFMSPSPLPSDPRLNRLVNAHRVGMRGMETMGLRYADDTRSYAKFSQNPSFGEDIKWLLSVSIQLGPVYVLNFFESGARVIASPLLLLKLAYEAMKLFPPYSNFPLMPLSTRPPQQNQLTPVKYSNPSQGQVRHAYMSSGHHGASAELMESAVEMFYAAATHKLSHPRFMPSDTDEIINLLHSAREGMLYIPNSGKQIFDEFMKHVRKQKACKQKEVMSKVNQIAQEAHGRHQHHNMLI